FLIKVSMSTSVRSFRILGRKHEINSIPGCPSKSPRTAAPTVQSASTPLHFSERNPFFSNRPNSLILNRNTFSGTTRPHGALGPGFPEPTGADVAESGHRHKLPASHRIVKTSVLGGLHHEYSLVKEAA